MARKIIEDLKVNKLSKELYDQMVSNGTITPSMIEEQAWLFTDQAFISEDDLKKIKEKEIPTKLSQFENDTKFITKDSIPKNLSEFNNDTNYASVDSIPTKVSELENDIPYAKYNELPTKVSELINDSDFASRNELPTKLSELINDDNYAKINNIPTKVSELENDVPYAKKTEIPVKISELENDSKYATVYQLPVNVSELVNDANYATVSQIPTNISELNNDSKYVKENDNISKLTNDVGYLNKETDPTVPAWAKEATKPTYTKAEVGLGNVENKSSATIRSELTTKNITDALGFIPLDESVKGVPGGVATLGIDGTVPSSQLPSYVDDVVEFDIFDNFPATGEPGKIYVDCSNNKTYRWSGTRYTSIGGDVTLGETSSTAYPGDKGKIAYDHAKSKHAPADAEENIIDSITVNGIIQPIHNKTAALTVPTKLSELTNDVGYSEVTDIPTKVSDLINDVPYAKQSELPTDLSQLNNDEGFIKSSDLPTKVSELANDVPYAKVAEVPTKLSELENDANYIQGDGLPTKLSELENDVGYLVADGLPTKVSELENDAGYLVAGGLPTKVSELENDSEFITADDDINGNAATASKLEQAISITVKDHSKNYSGTSTIFDGSSNIDLPMPDKFKGTLYGNVISDKDTSWINSVNGDTVIKIEESGGISQFAPFYSMKTQLGAYSIGAYRKVAEHNTDRNGFNIVFFKNSTIEAGTNEPDYLWNFNEDGTFNPTVKNQDLGKPGARWNKIYSKNEISNLYSTITFGHTNNIPDYVAFCKVKKSNAAGRTQATFIVSGTGDFGGNIPGTYLVTICNRRITSGVDLATMTVSCLQPYHAKNASYNEIEFGFYSDNEYYYFGAYQDKWSYQRNVICIAKEDSEDILTIGNLYQSNIKPDNWTAVDISYSVAGADTVPVGAIVPYAGSALRDSYILCDGRELSRIMYKELFDVIGTLYGAGDGSTTFNIPDLRHRVPVGKDTGNTKFNTLGKEYGEETHTLTISEMPTHNHRIKEADVMVWASTYGVTGDRSGTSGTDMIGSAEGTRMASNEVLTQTKGGGQAHNNIQPSLTVNYMIKIKAEVGVLYPIERSITNKSDHHLVTSDIAHNIVDAVKDDILKSLGLYNNTYSSTKTYKINDLVVYDQKLWACKTAITTAEAWNEAHWTRQSILDIK